MEILKFDFIGEKAITSKIHVGVVSSGDLEIIMEPTLEKKTCVEVITGSDGFRKEWELVLQRFFSRYPLNANVYIHDFGATPGVINLRLTQAMEGGFM